MIPSENQNIIVHFKNGIQIEGVVVSWSDDKSVIRSPAGTSIIVINNTVQDVLFYKFSLGKEEYEKLREIPKKQQSDIKKIAELKIELNELEKQEIADRLRTHQPSNMRRIEYGLPHSNIKIESAFQRPGKEASPRNSELSAGLQDLFKKKY